MIVASTVLEKIIKAESSPFLYLSQNVIAEISISLKAYFKEKGPPSLALCLCL